MKFVNLNKTYFDTGYIPNSATSVQIKFRINSSNWMYHTGIFGSYDNFYPKSFCLAKNYTYANHHFWYQYASLDGEANVNIDEGGIYEAYLCNSGVSLNNQVLSSWTGIELVGSFSCFIGSFSTNRWAQSDITSSSIDIFSCKIWENGVLLYDYVPVEYNSYGALKNLVDDTYLAANVPSAATYQNRKWTYFKNDTAKDLNISKIAFAQGITVGENIYLSTLPNITYTGQSQNDEAHGYPWDNRVWVDYYNAGSSEPEIAICGKDKQNARPNINVTDEIADGKTWIAGNFSPDRYRCQDFDSKFDTALANNLIAIYVPVSFEPSKSSFTFAASGGSNTFNVISEAVWSATTETDWITLSQNTGETGTTSITLTVPNYTGETKRTGIIVFTDADGNTFNVTVKQKPPQSGVVSNLYMGEENITTIYLGEEEITTLYLGENEVFKK